jgi:hypothetical protein
MEPQDFLEIAVKNLPGGLVLLDLKGKVRAINEAGQHILGLTAPIEPGTDCERALKDHPKLAKILLSTCESLNPANRQEITTTRPDGEKIVLGYGTLILKSGRGEPVGVGMNFQDITRYIPLPLQAQFIRLVDRFFTPFATLLVLAAAWMGFADPGAKHIAIGVLLVLFIFNEASVAVARRHVEWAKKVGNTRLVTNFLANVVLVYLLGTFWGPMWLLFVLTPVATALYADWKTTAITGLISAGALLGIYASRGLEGAVGWGQASVHAAFIVFISLFVNSIARLVMQIRSATPLPDRQAGAPQQRPAIAIPSAGKSPSESRKLAA